MDEERERFALEIIPGGPLHRLWIRLHASGADLALVHRRALALVLIAWVPLVVLDLLDPSSSPHRESFVQDIATHSRLLIALPLLIVAEIAVHRRTRSVVQSFVERGIIAESSFPRFQKAIAGALRVRDSVLLELLLVALVIVTTIHSNREHLPGVLEWVNVSPGSNERTLPGLWYVAVSMPVFRFVLVRWYVRLINWGMFLFRVSRMDLVLEPLHPDRCGGVGFLVPLPLAFAPLVFAHGVIVAGRVANGILIDKRGLLDYRIEMIIVTVLILIVALLPLISFMPPMAKARRRGLHDYGLLAQSYVRGFVARWLGGKAPETDQLLGTPDIQSLADLANSFSVVQGMRLMPVSRQTVLYLCVATLAPIAPLMLTMFSVGAVLSHLVKLVF